MSNAAMSPEGMERARIDYLTDEVYALAIRRADMRRLLLTYADAYGRGYELAFGADGDRLDVSLSELDQERAIVGVLSLLLKVNPNLVHSVASSARLEAIFPLLREAVSRAADEYTVRGVRR